MENLRNRIDVKLVNNEKMYIKTKLYVSHKIFGNNLVAIRKSKFALKLNKPAYIGMCILELSKLLITNFIMITLKITMTANQNYYSQKLIVYFMKLKLKMSMEILAAIKKY